MPAPSQRLCRCTLLVLSSLAAAGLCARVSISSEENASFSSEDVARQNASWRSDGTEVVLLVTRHGLSCADVAQQWSGLGNSLQHTMMTDPALTDIGISDAKAQGEAVQEWMREWNFEGVDIRVSSVLQRSVETAFYQYPETLHLHGGREQVHIAPYIREPAHHGLDNSARPFEEQKAKYPSGFSAYGFETASAEAARGGMYASGSWDDFLDWLSALLHKSYRQLLHKGGGGTEIVKTQPIVVAVTTHSHFMAETEDFRECRKVWSEKPANDQVVALWYVMQEEKLWKQYACAPVLPGVLYDTAQPICKRDIGDRCEFVSEPPTLDARFKKLAQKGKDDKAQQLLSEACQDRKPLTTPSS